LGVEIGTVRSVDTAEVTQDVVRRVMTYVSTDSTRLYSPTMGGSGGGLDGSEVSCGSGGGGGAATGWRLMDAAAAGLDVCGPACISMRTVSHVCLLLPPPRPPPPPPHPLTQNHNHPLVQLHIPLRMHMGQGARTRSGAVALYVPPPHPCCVALCCAVLCCAVLCCGALCVCLCPLKCALFLPLSVLLLQGRPSNGPAAQLLHRSGQDAAAGRECNGGPGALQRGGGRVWPRRQRRAALAGAGAWCGMGWCGVM
jgi:hypothetical protein